MGIDLISRYKILKSKPLQGDTAAAGLLKHHAIFYPERGCRLPVLL